MSRAMIELLARQMDGAWGRFRDALAMGRLERAQDA